MNRKKMNLLALLTTALGLTVLLANCTGTSSEPEQPAVPVAKITSPEANNNLPVDQDILVTFNAADIKGIAQVELSINGEAVMVEPVSPPVNSYTASYRWRPTQAGTQVIELTAFNVEQTASSPDQVIVTVIGGGTSVINPTTEPTSTEIAAVENTPTTTGGDSPVPTATPVPFATPTVAPLESADNQPKVTMLTGLNVRQGPGTNYPIIGRLAADDSAVITGRNEFSSWWQIEFNSDVGNRGWVAASAEFSQATNADNVPVVAAPSLEDIPAPTAPPAPAASQKPTIFSFTADRYTIAPNENVTLKWDLENAQAAFLRYNDKEEGVVAPGSKTVSPDEDTRYVLVARNEAGETTAELSIEVSGSTPTPVPVYRDGKIRVGSKQSVDFDEGTVYSEADEATDFIWDSGSQSFTQHNGASGALVGRDYKAITLNDCLGAAYDIPISGVDGSGQVAGCYITSEDRYGKFFVSDWDLSGNLTVEWITWNYKR
ncbi:MAG: SH3 domain-containing protein [Anaerolineaceae bacterium]|nr:SH3 domain-containing protein [Anaerolineaceae bacterium]